MESIEHYKVLLDHLDWNVQHLREILKNPKTVYYRDASIQRFGFAFDLAFKCLKIFIEKEEIKCSEIEDYFKVADQCGWLSGSEDWKLIVKDNYSIKNGFRDVEEDVIYNNLKNHLIFLKHLHRNLNKNLSRHGSNKSMTDNLNKL
tara:strand:+ start:811 stop:1248 length:438 start_codon:yes stop_codon:yes gene_type:complete